MPAWAVPKPLVRLRLLLVDKAEIDALRAKTIPDQELLVGGDWIKPESGRQIEVTSPIDGTTLCRIAEGSATDVDRAVVTARRAFDKGVWSRAAPADRKRVLLRLASLIEREQMELTVLGIRDNGTEIGMAMKSEPGSAANTFRYYAEALDKIYGEIAPTAPGTMGLIHREPVGVVGAIVPWNMPMMIGAWKLAPALAMGNSVVLKPAEAASLSLLKLGELALEAGLPEGVLNIVTGPGHIVGEAIGLHPGIDVLVFTGSGAVGRRLLEYSARSNLKRVFLELGGKSPNVVFNDAADLSRVARVSANGMFRNSGQVCVAASRLLVQKDVHKELVEKIIQLAGKLRVGDPLDPENDIGAVIHAEQLTSNRAALEIAAREGATDIFGGEQILQESNGFYMRPAVIDGVTREMSAFREEIFGPILAVTPFEDEEEAVDLANATEYGLAAGLWTSDVSRAHRMVDRIRAGVVHVNTYGGSDLTVPLGGLGQSGNGHDKSLHAIDKYTNLKTGWFQL